MSGICDKCRCESCHAQGEGIRFCDFYVGGESNYEKLFGTPERAARTLKDIKCGDDSCVGCPIVEPCADQGVLLDDGKALHDSLLEWLKGDAELEHNGWHCSACGYLIIIDSTADLDSKHISYCPNCGAKVVEP